MIAICLPYSAPLKASSTVKIPRKWPGVIIFFIFQYFIMFKKNTTCLKHLILQQKIYKFNNKGVVCVLRYYRRGIWPCFRLHVTPTRKCLTVLQLLRVWCFIRLIDSWGLRWAESSLNMFVDVEFHSGR